MKIAITDANIFIELIKTGLDTKFFSLALEVHTSFDVLEELHDDQKHILKAYAASGKLSIHILSQADQTTIRNADYPRSLSPQDKTVIFLARKYQAMILTGDKPVRMFAAKDCIECHGFLWILDELISNRILTKKEAHTILNLLYATNMFYQNNMDLKKEIEKRLLDWSK